VDDVDEATTALRLAPLEPLIAPVALPRRSVGSRTRALEAGAAAALVLSAAGLGSLFGLLSGSNPQPSRSASGAAIVVAFDDTANSLRAIRREGLILETKT